MPLLFALAVGLLAVSAGLPLARKLWPSGSTAEQASLAGGLALAAAAYLIFLLGLAGQLRLGIYVAGATLTVAGLRDIGTTLRHLRPTRDQVLPYLPVLLLGMTASIAALTPPLTMEWDSLAYHLALPKIWLTKNAVVSLPYDHHSYFPQLTEMLFAAGHLFGGYAAAKPMHTLYAVFAAVAAAGWAARNYGRAAGPWAALAVAACPLAFWEAGTAYVDMSTALYTSLCVLLLTQHVRTQEKGPLAGAAVCAGLTAATKYNGLLTIFLLALVALAWLRSRSGVRAAATILLLGLLVASPWYARTALLTGNPVYPFGYRYLGGKYWSAKNDVGYREEQRSFGVSHTPVGLLRIPWDVSAQPERYLNQGGLLGAIGLPLALAPFLLPVLRRRTGGLMLAFVGLNLLAWYFLSQQSRYILALAPLLATLAGALAAAEPSAPRRCMQWALMLQAAFLFATLGSTALSLGPLAFATDQTEWLRQHSPEYAIADNLNTLPTKAKIALYDTVTGYYIDRDYSWSNPGHHTLIPYDDLVTGHGLIGVLHLQGFTHVLLDTQYWTTDQDGRLRMATGHPEPWRRLVLDAVTAGLLTLDRDRSTGRYLLFEIAL